MNHDENSENPNAGDAAESRHLLVDQIIPLYFQMTEDGNKSATADFSARRIVKQHIENTQEE